MEFYCGAKDIEVNTQSPQNSSGKRLKTQGSNDVKNMSVFFSTTPFCWGV